MEQTIKNIKAIFILALILVSCSRETPENNSTLETIPRHAIDSEKATNSKERVEWMNKKRMGGYDAKKVTQARIRLGKEYKSNQMNTRDGGITAWESLGPLNIGGRIRAIAVDPDDGDHIFIGAAAGGIWESMNGGSSWTLSNAIFESYPVMDIKYHPDVEDVIFAVTGEFAGGGPAYPGIGVLRSTDNGTSWVQMGQPTDHDFSFLSKVRFNSQNVDEIYVSGTSKVSGIDRGTIYKSSDFGTTWDRHWYEESNISGNVYDFEINPNNPDTMWLGTGHHLCFSSNGFDTYSIYFLNAVNGFIPQRCEVQLCESDPDNVFVLRYLGKIGNTTANNKYRTELYQKLPNNAIMTLRTSTEAFHDNATFDNILGQQGNYDNTLWINPVDCSSVIMGGIDLWKYDTLSDVHTRISDWVDDIGGNQANGSDNSVHADHHVIIEHPDFDGGSNQTVFFGNDGGIYKTDDLNDVSTHSNWVNLSDGLNITQLYGADISYDGKSVVGGAQDNSYFSSTTLDQNLDWNVYSTGDGGFSFIDKVDNNTIYGTTQNGKIYRSEDGGQTFCHILNMDSNVQFSCCNSCQDFTYINENPLFIAPFKGDPNNSSRLFIGGNRLYRSIDKGEHWSPITDDAVSSSNRKISAFDIAKSNSDVIYVGYDTGLLRKTTVGGGDVSCCWTDVSAGLPNKYITDVAIHPSDSDKVAVTLGGYNQLHVYVTFDGGDNWINRSLDFDMHVNTITWLANHSNRLYIGTDVGIFASNNLGVNWNVSPLFDNNEGPVYTGVEELFWQGDGSLTYPFHLCAASHGRGLWRTPEPIEGQKLYVDRLCDPCGFGTIASPFKTFEEAYEAASPTQSIYFLEGGQYYEIPNIGVLDKQINIINNDNSPVIIE